MPRPSFAVSLGQTACAILAFALLFALGGWLALRFSVGGDEVRVPDLSGLAVDEARARLAAIGIAAEVDANRLEVGDIPADHVARQDPGPGTALKRMRTVRLMLSTGPLVRALPTMVGDPATQARIALAQQDIRVEYIASVYTDEVARDLLIAQEPQPAELTPASMSALRLLKSLGPRPRRYVMPDLFGRPIEDVERFLIDHGFRIGQVRPHRTASVPVGTVVGQRPSPGFRVEAGAEIDLDVSR